MVEQITSDPPEVAGISFACDVMKQEKQLILVVRECVTSYTVAAIIENERHETLYDALIPLCIGIRPLDGPPAVVRTDPAPGFQALVDDELLRDFRILVEMGRVKNKNKNPVAEKTIQELQEEILRHDPTSQGVNPVSLAVPVAALNSVKRHFLERNDDPTESVHKLSDSALRSQYDHW